MTVEMDFYGDWIDHLRRELTAAGYPAQNPGDQREVCLQYFNYQKRRVDVRPRAVLESVQFVVPPDVQVGYTALKAKMQNGDDLRPHLSRLLARLNYDDPMLNDWGVHHFHLGTVIEGDGFVDRTGPLLYARVLPDRILCLQILAHQNWTNRDLIETWHTNWPDTLAPYRLPADIVAPPNPTEQELQRLRRAHVNTHVQVPDGTNYAPPGSGATTSGVAVDVAMTCNRHRKIMRGLERYVRDNIGHIVQAAGADGVTLPTPCRFRLQVDQGSFVAVEQVTNWRHRLPSVA